MKENVLDILMYLFEHYMDADNGTITDNAAIRDHLDDAGFQHHDIDKALTWLEDLIVARELSQKADGLPSPRSFRVFTAQESAKLDTECRGFLVFLEHNNVLSPTSRELVIDRAMALEQGEIDLSQLKWVILMVLFNQPGQEEAYAWMEDLLMEDTSEHIH